MRRAYDKMYSSTYEHLSLPATIANLPWYQTNMIPVYAQGTMDHASDIVAGDFSQVLVGQRLGLQIRVLTERYAENGQVGFVAYFHGDIQVPRPKALALYRGLKVAPDDPA